MPSRMEKYYKSNEIKRRTAKNENLYKSIYDEAEYSNVEGISVIEKNEKIDLDKIYELIQGAKKEEEPKKEYVPKEYEEITVEEESKNYDILDVLSKAKTERIENDSANTQYNILKGIDLNKNYKAPEIDNEELKNIIEEITNNSKNDPLDLFEELKTLHENNLKEEIEESVDVDENPTYASLDKSFYTSSLNFTDDDFEQIKDSISKNSKLTKVLFFLLGVVIVTGILLLIYVLVK